MASLVPPLGSHPKCWPAFGAGSAAGDPRSPSTAGESLTELDALEGLLIDSGDDMATLLADWDAGSTAAFEAKMQLTALELGLKHTRITDPSGSDPGTVSTPDDLIRLGEAAMKIPVFSQIVSLGEATLPVSGLKYNPNFDLGEDGIIGIMVASNAATNGCYLLAAQEDRAGSDRDALWGGARSIRSQRAQHGGGQGRRHARQGGADVDHGRACGERGTRSRAARCAVGRIRASDGVEFGERHRLAWPSRVRRGPGGLTHGPCRSRDFGRGGAGAPGDPCQYRRVQEHRHAEPSPSTMVAADSLTRVVGADGVSRNCGGRQPSSAETGTRMAPPAG